MNTLKRIRGRIYRLISGKSFKQINFESEFKAFKGMDVLKRFDMDFKEVYRCLDDNTSETGFDAHYVYHVAWAIRVVKVINPVKHIDISSSLYFCSTLSAFIPTEFYDYRPANLTLDKLQTGKADLTKLHFESNSVDSLSCMHTIEHIGLGRYGDPIDPEGDVKAIAELKRVIKPNGNILFVVPVGMPKIAFNAHRIYATKMVLDLFKGFTLKQFSLVTDANTFHYDAILEEADKQNYGCGCFWFTKD